MNKIIRSIIVVLLAASFAASPLAGVQASASKALVVPTPVAPANIISDTTPTFTWTKLSGATQYQYQLYRGTTLVYTKTVASSTCGATANCLNTPAAVLPFAAYTWKVRALIDSTWRAFSAAKPFSITNTPTPIAPSGAIAQITPNFIWTRIQGVTRYQFQLYKGTTLVYTQTVLASACGTSANCANKPAKELSAGTYTWKVRAMLSGAWKGFSLSKAFTLNILPGFNSQFTANAAGWTPVNGAWSVAGGYYQSPGLANKVVSSAHINNYATLTYEVKMMRTGCEACISFINFRGSPRPLTSDGDWNNYYQLTVTNDGRFQIGYAQNGVWHYFVGWTYSSAVTNGWNTLKVTARGSFLQFFINGTRVAYSNYYWIPAFPTGQVGLGYYRDSTSTGNTLLIDYATLTGTAPASSPSSEGLNLDTLPPLDAATAANPYIAP